MDQVQVSSVSLRGEWQWGEEGGLSCVDQRCSLLTLHLGRQKHTQGLSIACLSVCVCVCVCV